jgi:hypothetical protein
MPVEWMVAIITVLLIGTTWGLVRLAEKLQARS